MCLIYLQWFLCNFFKMSATILEVNLKTCFSPIAIGYHLKYWKLIQCGPSMMAQKEALRELSGSLKKPLGSTPRSFGEGFLPIDRGGFPGASFCFSHLRSTLNAWGTNPTVQCSVSQKSQYDLWIKIVKYHYDLYLYKNSNVVNIQVYQLNWSNNCYVG